MLHVGVGFFFSSLKGFSRSGPADGLAGGNGRL